jgi:hypothetical protein
MSLSRIKRCGSEIYIKGMETKRNVTFRFLLLKIQRLSGKLISVKMKIQNK